MAISAFKISVPVRPEHDVALSVHCNMQIRLFHPQTWLVNMCVMCGHAYIDGDVKFQAWS